MKQQWGGMCLVLLLLLVSCSKEFIEFEGQPFQEAIPEEGALLPKVEPSPSPEPVCSVTLEGPTGDGIYIHASFQGTGMIRPINFKPNKTEGPNVFEYNRETRRTDYMRRE